MTQTTPVWKIAATVGGSALTGAAVWLNATHIAHTEGWGSPLVAAGVIVTLCAAVTPPFAERAAKTGQPAKAVLLWTFFALAVSFSLSASIARSSGYASGKVATVEQANESAKLAKEAYEAAKQTQQDECKKRGTRCRAAEDAVTAARAKLATSAPVQSADPGAERLAAVLGIQPSTVQLYAPLLLPLGLELGGFIFLAAGLAPRRREGLEFRAGCERSPAAAKIAAVERRCKAWHRCILPRSSPTRSSRRRRAVQPARSASIRRASKPVSARLRRKQRMDEGRRLYETASVTA